jgi:valyl-tRNA synthetase
MELEQISKQVDWLDDERRKEKLKIGGLEERLTAVEGNVPPLAHQIKDLESKITRLEALLSGPFADKAPAAIVQKEREKLAAFQQTAEKIRTQLQGLA